MTTTYKVNDLYLSIQGEGVQTGVPMIVLRMMGCPVGCPFCDTKETWEAAPENEVTSYAFLKSGKPLYVDARAIEIATYVRQLAQAHQSKAQWILLTGGEPAEQPIRPLIAELHRVGYKVALETSGTAQGHLPSDEHGEHYLPPPKGMHADWVCVSPKIGMPGGRSLRAAAMSSADELKMVVGKMEHVEMLHELLRMFTFKPSLQICLQPISQSAKATKLCVEVCQVEGWRLSIQTHRYIGLA